MPSTYTPNPANNPASYTIPADGDGPIKAADVNVPIGGLADKAAHLDDVKAPKLNPIFDGTVAINGPGVLQLEANTTLQADDGSTIDVNGTLDVKTGSVLETLPSRPADNAVIVVDATTPARHVLLPVPALVRTVTMKSTSTARTLAAGLVCRLQLPFMAAGKAFNVKREDATLIAELWGWEADPATSTAGATWVEVYWDGSHWRGLAASGYVVPGAGW